MAKKAEKSYNGSTSERDPLPSLDEITESFEKEKERGQKMEALCLLARSDLSFLDGPPIEVKEKIYPREVFAYPTEKLEVSKLIRKRLHREGLKIVGDFLYYQEFFVPMLQAIFGVVPVRGKKLKPAEQNWRELVSEAIEKLCQQSKKNPGSLVQNITFEEDKIVTLKKHEKGRVIQ